jgi:hypothetical protein
MEGGRGRVRDGGKGWGVMMGGGGLIWVGAGGFCYGSGGWSMARLRAIWKISRDTGGGRNSIAILQNITMEILIWLKIVLFS